MIEAIAFIALISVFGMISATLRAAKKSSGSARPQRAPERPQTVRGGAPAAKAAMAYGGSPAGKAGMAFGVPAGAQPGRTTRAALRPHLTAVRENKARLSRLTQKRPLARTPCARAMIPATTT